MGWSISPVVPYEIINGKLVAHCGINTSQSEIVYTITYDENGCVSTYTYIIPPCESDTCIIAQQTVQFDKNEQNSAIIASYNDSCDVSTASYTVSLVSPTTDIFVNNVSFNNNKTITAHINANSDAERYNKVILSMGSTTKEITITQASGVIHRCGINMGDAIIVDSGSHSNQLIGTYNDCEGLTPTVTSNNTDFIAASDISFSNGRIYANISGNESHESRNAYITIQMGGANKHTTIEQEGIQLICDITMDASFSFTYNSYTDEEIGTYTNCEGDVPVVTSTNTDFIPTSNVSFDDGKIYLSIDGNESTSPRSATITIDMGEAYESTIITQEGKPAPTPCEITLLSSKTVGSEAGSDVEVGSYNQYCTVANISATSSNQSFIDDNDITIENGTISLSYGENEGENSRSTVITVTYNGGDTKTLSFTQNAASSLVFDELLDEFNPVLQSRGISQISEEGTPNTYQYLKTMYDETIREYQGTNDLFNKSNFPDAYDFHGDNDENSGITETMMASWVMASCLSELFPSYEEEGYSNSNNQTEFFKKAYELGSGSSIGIYDTSVGWGQGYTMKSDPIICRLVASEVYAHMRGKYTFDYIDGLRSEVDSDYVNGIQGSIWNDLVPGYFADNRWNVTFAPKNTGYIVDSASLDEYYRPTFIPSAPGPYAQSADPGHGYPWDGSNGKQPKELFYNADDAGDREITGTLVLDGDSTDIDWAFKNYKRDVEIDEYIVKNYNLGSWSHGRNGEIIGFEKNSDYDKKVLLLHAAIMPDESLRYFFGSKTLTFKGTTDSVDELNHQFTKYIFSEKGEEPIVDPGALDDTGDDTDYVINGPFGDLENYMFDSNWDATETMTYIDTVRVIGNNARKATNNIDDLGNIRRRPLGDWGNGECDDTGIAEGRCVFYGRKGDGGVNGHPLNGLGNGTAQALFTRFNNEAIEKFNGDDFPRDPPNSYISGHASQTWMMGLMLAQMFSQTDGNGYANAKKYLKGAYSIGVGRTIGRYHWNSDTLYGRLNASMNFPIVNAMSGNKYRYETAKSVLIGSTNIETAKFDGTFASITIVNRTSTPIYSTGVGAIYIKNPYLSVFFDLTGGGLINHEQGLVVDGSCNRIEIGGNDSDTFNNVYYRINSNDPSDAYEMLAGREINPSKGYLYTDGLTPDGYSHYHINGAFTDGWEISGHFTENGSYTIYINSVDYSPTADGWQYVTGLGSCD